MTLRRVIVTGHDNEVVDDAPLGGAHVLLTVEEYRERIEAAYREGWIEGWVNRTSETRSDADDWRRSATKRRLDEEVGNG